MSLMHHCPPPEISWFKVGGQKNNEAKVMPLLGMVRGNFIGRERAQAGRSVYFPAFYCTGGTTAPAKSRTSFYRPDPRLLSAKARRQRNLRKTDASKRFCRSVIPKPLLPCGRRPTTALRHLAAADD